MKIATLALGILLCSAAIAEPQPWMKKENPDTLHFNAFAEPDCPFSNAELTDLVNGVLVRSRLRPGDYFDSEEVFGFSVVVGCLEKEPGSQFFIYNIDISFIRYLLGRNFTEIWPIYGGFGQGIPDSIKGQVKASVESLITDYLQANFDLAPE